MCIILAPCKPRLPVEGWGGWVPEHSPAWVSGQRDPILSPVARDLDLCSRRPYAFGAQTCFSFRFMERNML